MNINEFRESFKSPEQLTLKDVDKLVLVVLKSDRKNVKETFLECVVENDEYYGLCFSVDSGIVLQIGVKYWIESDIFLNFLEQQYENEWENDEVLVSPSVTVIEQDVTHVKVISDVQEFVDTYGKI